MNKKIRLEKLELWSYRSFNHFLMDFKENPRQHNDLTIIEKANGTGKTTLLESISYLINLKKDLNNKLIKNMISNGRESFRILGLFKISEAAVEKLKHFSIRGASDKENNYQIDFGETNLKEYKKELNNWILPTNIAPLFFSPDFFNNATKREQRGYLFLALENKIKFFENIWKLINENEIFKNADFLEIYNSIKDETNDVVKYDKLVDKIKDALKFFTEAHKIAEIKYNFLIDKKIESVIVENTLKREINEHQQKILLFKLLLAKFEKIETESALKLNEIFKEQNFNFRIETKETENGKWDLEIERDGVPFNSLNTASKLLASIKLSLFFQKMHGIECFILLDNAERLDFKSFQALEKISLTRQVIATFVKGIR
ncbi:DNA replication/repair protein RecF [Mesomycoplasma molare]|uniref:DNA replication and repair protein RecF n=1 Tax=Mesomycoplasma molare TaxID=171288 RepID=A0ABY5TTP1_9BACT|nr:hypothetical protein [Mesomycoplasma molare]UWD34033.1 hypothetical protein NX772_02920 [Mesomycoplasma molare]